MKDYIPTLSLLDAPSTWCIGDDIRVMHGIYTDFAFPSEFHFRDFFMIYLKQGVLKGKRDGEDTLFTAPCMITLQPNNVLTYGSTTENVDATTISFSPDFTQRLNLMQRFQLNEVFHSNPSLRLDEQMEEKMESYIRQLIELGKNPENPFIDEALLHLTLSFFYGVGYFYYQNSRFSNRSHQIVNEFTQLVEQYGAQEHQVLFYANRLHLSSKYLQTIVRQITGRTVYSWVNDVILTRAKQMLGSGQYTLQQVANELRFCDQSYFGVFFKRETGMTPRQYQNSQSVLATNK